MRAYLECQNDDIYQLGNELIGEWIRPKLTVMVEPDMYCQRGGQYVKMELDSDPRSLVRYDEQTAYCIVTQVDGGRILSDAVYLHRDREKSTASDTVNEITLICLVTRELRGRNPRQVQNYVLTRSEAYIVMTMRYDQRGGKALCDVRPKCRLDLMGTNGWRNGCSGPAICQLTKLIDIRRYADKDEVVSKV